MILLIAWMVMVVLIGGGILAIEMSKEEDWDLPPSESNQDEDEDLL